jgi:hypothetical protein
MSKPPNYDTGDDVMAWYKACGFGKAADAAKAIDISWRQFMRWKANGIPKGSHGRRIAKQMTVILKRKTR